MRKLVTFAAFVILLQAAQDQSLAYVADSTTNNVIRLFTNSVTNPAVPSPVGTSIWFVADTNNNGIDNIGTTAFNSDSLQAIFNGTSNDKLIFSDTVDGQILGNNPGNYTRNGINVNDAFSSATIYVFLFNDGTPLVGPETLGTLSLGVIPAPAVGTAQYIISSNIFADQYTVNPVPEASSWAMLAIGCVVVAGSKFFRRCRNQA